MGYYANETAEQRAKRLAYNRKYWQRNRDTLLPKVRAHQQKPKVKERERARAQTPRYKEVARAYKQRPDVKAKNRIRVREYCRRPEVRTRQLAYMQSPEYKAWQRTNNISPNVLWRAARVRAQRKKCPFTIPFDDYEELHRSTKTCRYCGKKMRPRTRHAKSADEVVPGLGYVPGNIDIICKSCNSKKTNATAAEHEAFAARMREADRTIAQAR